MAITFIPTEYKYTLEEESIVHWGYADRGYPLCLSKSPAGQRRTALRLVNCEYCLNIIDLHLHEVIVENGAFIGFNKKEPIVIKKEPFLI